MPDDQTTPPPPNLPCWRSPWLQVIEPRRFHVARHALPIVNLPAELDGLRIVHLTDVHFHARWTPSHDRLLREIATASPDLILITGDMVDRKYDHRADLPLIQRLADGLSAPLGIFTILGNHDGDLLAPHFQQTKIQLIDHTVAAVPVGEATIELIGLPGVDRIELTNRWLGRIAPRVPGTLRVTLSHYPDFLHRARSLKPDLFLAGHTHGGQVCLPGGVPIVRHDSLPRAYCSGVHRIGDTWLAVSRGFGFAGIPVRLFCPSELTVLTLRRA